MVAIGPVAIIDILNKITLINLLQRSLRCHCQRDKNNLEKTNTGSAGAFTITNRMSTEVSNYTRGKRQRSANVL